MNSRVILADNAIPTDNPIRESKYDALNRDGTAESFVKHIVRLDISEGLVVGIFGPWGSGKTSFVNLAREKFKQADIPVLDFNPWMFSGAEDLVERFFAELVIQLKLQDDRELKRVAIGFESYAKMFSSLEIVFFPDTWIARIILLMRLLGEALIFREGWGGKREGIDKRREKLKIALKDFGKHIVVVLDDVDRLTAPEIRAIFKLVRLTANFPNIIYVMACERSRVERALQEEGLSGRTYMEKIIQLPFDLPEVPDDILQQQIASSLEASIPEMKDMTQHEVDIWRDISKGIVYPLIRTMRDLRRYVATVSGTVASLNGQVALADVLGLDAIRIFLPDVFSQLYDVIDILTVTSASGSVEGDPQNVSKEDTQVEDLPEQQDRFHRLIEGDRMQKNVVQAMLNYLFPNSLQYANRDMPRHEGQGTVKQFSGRRVAHKVILSLYMERVMGDEELIGHDVEQILQCMGQQADLDRFIRSLEPKRWSNVISKLSGLTEQFDLEHVKPGCIVLFNLFPDWPDDSNARQTIRNVTLLLLRLLQEGSTREGAVKEIRDNLNSFYSKTELIRQVGGRSDGDRLIADTKANNFLTELIKEVQNADVDTLGRERNLAEDFKFIKDYADDLNKTFTIPDSPEVTITLLQSATTKSTSNSQEIQRKTDWSLLTEVYGDERTLKERINSLNKQLNELKPWIQEQPWMRKRAISLSEIEKLVKDAEKEPNRRSSDFMRQLPA